jgi:hypothetical protein
MTTRRICSAVLPVVFALALAATAKPAEAHHAFTAEFDENACQDFNGKLTRLDWQSPHAFFYVDIENEDGEVEEWTFQTYSLITLRRNGTGREVFMANMEKDVYVRGCLARNKEERYAAAGLMRFEDGELRQVGQIQN